MSDRQKDAICILIALIGLVATVWAMQHLKVSA